MKLQEIKVLDETYRIDLGAENENVLTMC